MVADACHGRQGRAGMRAAVQQEQSQTAHDQKDRTQAQTDALPGAVARNFIIHGEMPLTPEAQTRQRACQLQFESIYFERPHGPQEKADVKLQIATVR